VSELPAQPARMPIVALTGAGVSAASGVPTFRGPGGLWQGYRAEDLATPEAFNRQPEVVWQFYAWRRQLIRGCRPNRAHACLAEIEHEVVDFTLITQNVDGLHQRAGSRRVIELHGSLWRMRCHDCGDVWEDLAVPLPELPPRCPSCGGLARPDVVWYGESLDGQTLRESETAAETAGTMLVVGTSALVQPAASIPLKAQAASAEVLEFNLERTPLSDHADHVFPGPAAEMLPAWWRRARVGLSAT
jgi:NAD-dependent deacetylase